MFQIIALAFSLFGSISDSSPKQTWQPDADSATCRPLGAQCFTRGTPLCCPGLICEVQYGTVGACVQQ